MYCQTSTYLNEGKMTLGGESKKISQWFILGSNILKVWFFLR